MIQWMAQMARQGRENQPSTMAISAILDHMARTNDKRNVVVIYTQASDGTWRGAGAEVQTDGTFVVGTAKTSTVSREAVRTQLISAHPATGTTPENSALYSNGDVHSEIIVEHNQIT